jgi:predicted transcriptional regulator
VWATAREKLPKLLTKFSINGYSMGTSLLMSIKPQYAQKILAGEKLIEIRKKFSIRWVGARAALYSSRPMSALVGEATIRSVDCGTPNQIWAEFGTLIGCSPKEFKDYVGLANSVSAIELSDISPYREPVPLSQVEHLLDERLRPPQSYCDLRLNDGSVWGKAVSVASLLHGRFTAGV